MLNVTQFRAALDPALLSDFDAILAVKNVSINAALASQEQAVGEAKIEIQSNLDTLVAAGQAAYAARSWDSINAVLVQAASMTSAAREVAKTARRAELQAQLDALG